MLVLLNYLIIYLSEFAIIACYISQVYGFKKIRWGKTIPVLFLIYLLLFLISFFQNMYINTFSFFICHVLFFAILMKERLSISMFHTMILIICMGIGELIVLNSSEYYAGRFYDYGIYEEKLIYIAILSKIIYLAVIEIFMLMFRKIKYYRQDGDEKISVISIPVLIASVWGIMTLFAVSVSVELPVIPGRMASISAVFFLVTDIAFVWIESINISRREETKRLEFMLMKENYLVDYYKVIKERDESQRVLIHDMKEHIQTIREMNKERNFEGVEKYIVSMYELPALQPVQKICERELLNALLTRYYTTCKQKNISFGIDIADGEMCFLNDRDLTVLFSNLMNNSIEASEGTEDAFVDLRIRRLKNGRGTMISIINKYSGKREKQGDEFITTKLEKKEHGYGLRSIKKLVKQHGGIMDISETEEDQCFHVNILFPE